MTANDTIRRKKLIEVALPLEAINVASAREKSIRHGHPSTLHLWWARRPLAAARAVIFTSLVDDPDDPDALPAFVEACRKLDGKNFDYENKNVNANGDTPRMRLFDFIEKLVTWEATTDEKVLNKARELILIATEGNPPPLLDPFAGGGSIPLEAQRLGLEAHASDLNPVAVMINKAQIEIPPRFANMPPVNPRDREKMFGEDGKADKTWKGAAGLAADVRYYGEWMREKAWERIGHLYPTHNGETVIAWLWARTVQSPNPAVNAHVPLVRSFMLSKKKGRECWAKPIIEGNTIRFEVTQGIPPKDKDGTVIRTGGTCIISGEPIPFDYIREEGKAGRMSAMLMAIVTEGSGSRNYYNPDYSQIDLIETLSPSWQPDFPLEGKAAVSLPLYGMETYAELFTKRQLTTLNVLCDLISEVNDTIRTDIVNSKMYSEDFATSYAKSIAIYLAFTIDRSTNFWSTLAFWSSHPKDELVKGVFGRQALPMVWDFAEVNPFSNSGGNWISNLHYVAKSLEFSRPVELPGYAIQKDARFLEAQFPLIVSTDPPYYDNIEYADLSDYFYVWLRRSLKSFFPDIFTTVLTPKDAELIAVSHRHNGNSDLANRHFEEGLEQVFRRLYKFIDPHFPLTVYYAFKQVDDLEETSTVSTGWEKMLDGLVRASFTIEGTWPMRTELTTNLKKGINALASSIVLVCRPRPEDAPTTSRRAFVDALRRELPKALKEMQSGNIAPVDLAQASIGPGMAIYSRYSNVLEADGSPMSVRTALGLINQELDAYLAEQDGDIDGDTRFAVAWFTQFGFEEGEFGQADVLARAKNTSVAGVEAANIVVAGRGKVRLLHWKEYDPGTWDPTQDKRPTVWEATHHLIERLNSHGETGSAMLMTKMPHDMAAEARQLAYRLYSICERKSWADHARDYNALVISWAEIGTEAVRLRDAAESGEATTQMNLFGEE